MMDPLESFLRVLVRGEKEPQFPQLQGWCQEAQHGLEKPLPPAQAPRAQLR